VKSLRSAVKRVWPTARHDLEEVARALAASPWSRPWLNVLYRRVPLARAGGLHARFAKLFRGATRQPSAGRWDVNFVGRRLSVALRPDTAWLDWDAAMSLLGHEVEIKQTYEALIRSGQRPDLFVDVGANYGLHSLLFLVHGIATLSFEPNPACDRYFLELCALNRVTPSVVQVALGDHDGWTDLWFPESETWLGTIDTDARSGLALRTGLVSCRVRVETLDRHLAEVDRRRILIKIDTEGSDIAVLRGARRTLERLRPLVVFESFPGSDRPELYRLLESFRYAVAHLPWSPAQSGRIVTLEAFLGSPASNFLALPLEWTAEEA
jgi:FkbM family methyltransferase